MAVFAQKLMELIEYNFTNFTYDAALEYARIVEDAFKDSPLVLSLVPNELKYTAAHWPPIADVEQVRVKLGAYLRFVKLLARRAHQAVKSDPRKRVFILKNENGKLVACTLWILPRYVELPQLNLIARLQNYLRSLYYDIIDYVSYIGKTPPFGDNGAFSREQMWGRKQMGVEDCPEREEELAQTDRDDLLKIAYPKSLTYYLSILTVREDEQGKGYGKRVINESLKYLAPYQSNSQNPTSPIKATLLAAPAARGFYSSCGWHVGASAKHTLDNGFESIHTYFFRNLD